MPDAERIRERGWRQCSTAPTSLGQRVRGGNPPSLNEHDDLLVVVSQDCDIVCPSFELEPDVELLVARRLSASERDGNLFGGKNPRRLQFDLPVDDTAFLYEIRIAEKFSIARERLAEVSPISTALPDFVSGLLPDWVARRYTRAALPDEFNRRIRKAQEKIRKILRRHGEAVTALYMTLGTEAELKTEDSYPLLFTMVVPPSETTDEAGALRLQRVLAEVANVLASSVGVTLLDAVLRTENEFTLGDINRSIEWDVYDDLSYE